MCLQPSKQQCICNSVSAFHMTSPLVSLTPRFPAPPSYGKLGGAGNKANQLVIFIVYLGIRELSSAGETAIVLLIVMRSISFSMPFHLILTPPFLTPPPYPYSLTHCPLLSVVQEWNMGQRASNTCGITFEDVVVPNEVSKQEHEHTHVHKH